MKHAKKTRKLGRETGPRTQFIRSLAQALIVRGRISTTEARAKEIRPYVEKLVTKAKKGTVANRRDVLSTLGGDTRSTTILFKTIGPRYGSRAGGYTRIVKSAPRKGDAAKMAIIEFVE